MDILAALEGSAIATALKTSFVVYPLVNAAHILAVGTLVATVLMMDARILGLWKVPGDGLVAARRPIALGAFVLAALTGAAMFTVNATDYAANPAFRVKLALIALAAINFALFSHLERRRSADLRLPAALSALLWPAALVAGRFIGFL